MQEIIKVASDCMILVKENINHLTQVNIINMNVHP
jgi:hypothetical protein